MVNHPLLDIRIVDAEATGNDLSDLTTTYFIEVQAPNGESWQLCQDLQAFYELHERLTQLIASSEELRDIVALPPLPLKKRSEFFDTDLAQRQKDFQGYLIELFTNPLQVCLSECVCEFLAIPLLVKEYLIDLSSSYWGGLHSALPPGDSTLLVVGLDRSFVAAHQLPRHGVQSQGTGGVYVQQGGGYGSYSATSDMGGGTPVVQHHSLGNSYFLPVDEQNFPGGASTTVGFFLQRLRDFPNQKVATLQSCENWFFKSNLQDREDLCAKILIGDSNDGLIFDVGTLNENLVSNVAALHFISKLTNFQHCKSARVFANTLCSADPVVYLKAMHLQRLLRLNFGNVRLEVLQLLLLLSSKLSDAVLMEVLSKDAWAFKHFQRWRDLRQRCTHSRFLVLPNSSFPAHSSGREATRNFAHAKQEYENFAESSFTTLLIFLSSLGNDTTRDSTGSLLGDEGVQLILNSVPSFTGGKEDSSLKKLRFRMEDPLPETSSCKEDVFSKFKMDEESIADSENKANEEAFTDSDSLNDEPLTNPSPTPKEGSEQQWRELDVPAKFEAYKLSIGYCCGVRSEMKEKRWYMIRGSMFLPFPAALVAAAFADFKELVDELLIKAELSGAEKSSLLRLRSEHWSTKLRYMKTLEYVNFGTQVIDCSLEASHGPHILARMCLLKAMKYLQQDRSFLLVFNSTTHENFQKWDRMNCHRGSFMGNPLFIPSQESILTIKASGVRITPTSEKSCCLNAGAIIPAQSMFMISSDLLGESFHLWNSLSNLISLLQLTEMHSPNFRSKIISLFLGESKPQEDGGSRTGKTVSEMFSS